MRGENELRKVLSTNFSTFLYISNFSNNFFFNSTQHLGMLSLRCQFSFADLCTGSEQLNGTRFHNPADPFRFVSNLHLKSACNLGWSRDSKQEGPPMTSLILT